MWKYFPENFGTDKPVATFENEQNIRVLDVCMGSSKFFSLPKFNFLCQCSIEFVQAQVELEYINNESVIDYTMRMLEAASYKIQRNYYEQVKRIKKVIGKG